MSERLRTERPPGSQERGPSPEDVRRQLEGGLETVEAARERYAALVSLLSGKKWKRRLYEQPEVLRVVTRFFVPRAELLPSSSSSGICPRRPPSMSAWSAP